MMGLGKDGAFFSAIFGISENRGTPKSSILIGFSIINHPFWGTTIFGNAHISISFLAMRFKSFSECQRRPCN